MRIDKTTCPICGEPIRGTLEIVQGTALLLKNPDGSYNYAGETDIHWDTQEAASFDECFHGVCPNGHDWPITITIEEVSHA